MKILVVIAAFILSVGGATIARADGYWLYCQGTPVVCWQANPTVTTTVTPDPPTVPTVAPQVIPEAPVACPGSLAPVDGNCPPLPQSRVTTSDVNLRAGPGTSYNSLGIVPAGTLVSTSLPSGPWTPVTVNGQSGWISSNYLS